MTVSEATKKEIVKLISTELEKCCPPMVIKTRSEQGMQLMGNKEVVYGSKKELVPGMWFVGVVANKTMVSFHFFPMYYNEKTFIPLIPNSIKLLKGKTCFNYTKTEQVDIKELQALLKKGMEVWQKMGYMK